MLYCTYETYIRVAPSKDADFFLAFLWCPLINIFRVMVIYHSRDSDGVPTLPLRDRMSKLLSSLTL